MSSIFFDLVCIEEWVHHLDVLFESFEFRAVHDVVNYRMKTIQIVLCLTLGQYFFVNILLQLSGYDCHHYFVEFVCDVCFVVRGYLLQKIGFHLFGFL